MNNYELVFISSPELASDQQAEKLEKYVGIITQGEGKIIHQENWGLKKLAYPINKKNNGAYALVEFQCNGTLIAKLETELKRDEEILRFLTVKLDRHAVAYNNRKRNKTQNNEEVSNVNE